MKKKELDLGKDDINKLILAFSIPCIISMLINSIYNIVDQIFIGQGVGYLGNAATNVIFPIVIMGNALAGLFGNGAASNLSLRMGEGKVNEAKKSIGSTITFSVLISLIFAIVCYIFLGNLAYLFGCTKSVYRYALDYGRIILIGMPFMIIYSVIASIIRADGSPKYSMVVLLSGAILNIILDPIFIFGFKQGVKGGAIATVIGQFVSFIIAIAYIPKFKTFKLEKRDFKIDSSIKNVCGYGLSSFITQMTIMILFIYMNNVMTKYGALSKFGSDIPLSVYGVVSKINNFYVSSVLGIAIGSQPIIGFNYGAGNYSRVKEVLKKVLIINFIIGFIFNLLVVAIPKVLISPFGSSDNKLYIEFAVDTLRIFLGVSMLNALEMTSSIVLQSLGEVKKATFVAFARQIILFIPISLILSKIYGLYGILYAGIIADISCFIIAIFIFRSEYKRIEKLEKSVDIEDNSDEKLNSKSDKHIVITISREYGSGGRYLGKILEKKLGIKCYDKELMAIASKEYNFDSKYIEDIEEKRSSLSSLNYIYNNDDKLEEAYTKIIKDLYSKESCIIVGRCANYILKDKKDVTRIFIYNSLDGKIKRGIKYFGLDKNNAKDKIEKVNKLRNNYYKYYTGSNLGNNLNYDITFNSDSMDLEDIADIIKDIVLKK